LLKSHGVEAVADVRRFPASRRHPHFAREQLESFLATHGVGYHWMPELGGRRSAKRDSLNTGWRVAGFRGYADYMETSEFRSAFDALAQLASQRQTAIMCAESLWWQCHRRLIADEFLARGDAVMHIEGLTKASPHRLIPPAHLINGHLSYAAAQSDLALE
jgi:uncharacterized protein (DUF488 family)